MTFAARIAHAQHLLVAPCARCRSLCSADPSMRVKTECMKCGAAAEARSRRGVVHREQEGIVNRKERAQVVELLRCAADYSSRSCVPIWHAAQATTENASDIHRSALQAAAVVSGPHRLLEAAARVEEGRWP